LVYKEASWNPLSVIRGITVTMVNFTNLDATDINTLPDDISSMKSLVKDTVEIMDNDSDDSVLDLRLLGANLQRVCLI
jgi:hypothetical protein